MWIAIYAFSLLCSINLIFLCHRLQKAGDPVGWRQQRQVESSISCGTFLLGERNIRHNLTLLFHLTPGFKAHADYDCKIMTKINMCQSFTLNVDMMVFVFDYRRGLLKMAILQRLFEYKRGIYILDSEGATFLFFLPISDMRSFDIK